MAQTVLIVEDYEPLREVASRLLRSRGYTTIEVSSGEEALAVALAQKPDIILLDIGLPGIDGWETLSRLQSMQATAGIPVVIATAQGARDDVARGFSLGAMDYIVKPYSIEDLLAAFEAAFSWPASGRKRGDREGTTKETKRTSPVTGP